MSFHLGKPILAMIGISLLTGAAVLLRREAPRADLRVWVFADSHARSYRDRVVPAEAAGELAPSLVELYQRQTGRSAAVNLISTRALDVRLISLFNNQSHNVPDLVEVEIGSVGKFFRPPLDQVGFLPLNRFVEREGLMDKMVPSRFAPWSKQGGIFGIPHDLHPVTITYRKDLFDAAGVDLASAKTWEEFQDLCLRFQTYWRQKGVVGRYAIELPRIQSDYLVVMLLQRHLNIVDDYHRVHLSNPKVVDTIVRYAQMVAGPR
ncbi:MAG: ABC transporter substrate-binding protein, partial [Bacillota bacterium]